MWWGNEGIKYYRNWIMFLLKLYLLHANIKWNDILSFSFTPYAPNKKFNQIIKAWTTLSDCIKFIKKFNIHVLSGISGNSYRTIDVLFYQRKWVKTEFIVSGYRNMFVKGVNPKRKIRLFQLHGKTRSRWIFW